MDRRSPDGDGPHAWPRRAGQAPIDDGRWFFELRGLRVRGRTAAVDRVPDGVASSLAWLELSPEKVVAWDYGTSHEVADDDDAQVQAFLNRSMTMRVATLSTSGVPHLTPLRFVYDGRRIYALSGHALPTARHISEHPGVVLLFDAEQSTGPVLRVRAHTAIRGEPHLRGWWERRAATKYFLRPGGVWDMLTHWRNLPTWARIRRSVTPADTALIEFVPKTAEFVPSLSDEDRSKKGAGMVGVEDTVTSREQ